ncbi:MAG: hypothetical protein K940chlam9_01130, partial [Chlamydiae bacterium]|nr:hypothetical protein [Chlamydiota bacterium]
SAELYVGEEFRCMKIPSFLSSSLLVVFYYAGESMARYRGPKNRIARRFGANLFGRARNPLLRKPNPPGQHGARRRKKSDFGLQLDEKQKLKACYGMLMEKQIVNTFKKASHEKGNTAQHFMQKLECRLDNIVYRLRFSRTIFSAQQLVSHGHILVNGKKVDRRSFLVRPGMEISIREKSRKVKAIVESLEVAAQAVPDYLELDKDNFKGKLIALPELDQIEGQLPLPVNVPIVCEFLSHQT